MREDKSWNADVIQKKKDVSAKLDPGNARLIWGDRKKQNPAILLTENVSMPLGNIILVWQKWRYIIMLRMSSKKGFGREFDHSLFFFLGYDKNKILRTVV